MDKDIQQLVEMGATAAQARAALRKHKDTMEAASAIFGGEFDDAVEEDADVDMDRPESVPSRSDSKRKAASTPDESDNEDAGAEDNDEYDEGDFEYDSEPELGMGAGGNTGNADPYAGIFFSKDRREEVIEVEEESETATISEESRPVKLMTQSEWMKGCPEGGEQGFLFSLYNELSQGTCPCPNKCEYAAFRKKSDFFPILPLFSAYVDRLRTIIHKECPQCAKSFCFACGEPVSGGRQAKCDDEAMFHCPNLQGVLLGVGLFMLERLHAEQYAPSTPAVDSSEEKSRKAKRRKTESPTPAPEYEPPFADYSSPSQVSFKNTKGKKSTVGGIGYAGDLKEDTTGQDQALAAQHFRDEQISQTLQDIRIYLPSITRGRTSDYLVHPTTLAHLRRRFNYVCSSLLRNDSLADMSDRSVLYFELFHWLETISCHEALASMMAMPIMVLASTKPAPKKGNPSSKSSVREHILVYEGSSGPRELLESVYIQAEAALKSLEGPMPIDIDAEMTEEEKRMTNVDKGKSKEKEPILHDENAQMLLFCQRIQGTVRGIDRSLEETKGKAFVERLHASLFKIPGAHSEHVYVQASDTEEETKKTYLEWATRVRFEYCDLTIPQDAAPQGKGNIEEDALPHYKFYYNTEARMMARQDIPRRSLAIAKELAVLTTNLPVAWDSSIFLRVDEARVDVIKALIIGPDDTPYSNGCFLFDIFLPSTYNTSPPSVKYITTNGGKYRFNPNLYADGKVCLSLLGTWSGPGWVSGKSTLLQVLISIQSMILCDEPYLNEPAWSGHSGTPASKAYSANARRMVVRTAMLGNLRTPPEPFEDVIQTHYRLKARSISTQLDRWLEEDDGATTADDGAEAAASKHRDNNAGGGSSNGFKKDVDELKKLMSTL